LLASGLKGKRWERFDPICILREIDLAGVEKNTKKRKKGRVKRTVPRLTDFLSPS